MKVLFKNLPYLIDFDLYIYTMCGDYKKMIHMRITYKINR